MALYSGRGSPTLRSDHQPNVYLDSATNAHTVHRRASQLSVSCGYNYKWSYRPGGERVADPICRAPQQFASMCSLFCVAHCVEAMTVAQESSALCDAVLQLALCYSSCRAFTASHRKIDHSPASGAS
jgi:hypothetical protein